MKRIITLFIAVSAIVMSGCQNEKLEQPQSEKKSHKLVVNAYPDLETKTSVTAVAGGYQVEWDVNDFIYLHESAPKAAVDYYDAVRTYVSKELASEDIVDAKAAFVFEDIEDRPAEDAEYSYIAAYGISSSAEYLDWSTDAYLYEEWAEKFGHTGEYVDPHMVLQMKFMSYQEPLADSFDPMADMMVSKMHVSTEQLSGEASFSFARLGTIAKMTLTGLDEYVGCDAPSIILSFGDSFQIPFMIEYDPVLNKYVGGGDEELGGMVSQMEFGGESLKVKEDGTIDVWFRIVSGKLIDWFRVDLRLSDGTQEYGLARYVDLDALGKTIEFNEGKMTTFSVGELNVADVEPVGAIDYACNDAKNGFTATWDAVENSVGYDCYIVSSSVVKTVLTPSDNGDGTWSVTTEGLAKDVYYIYVRPIPAEGHELVVSDYSYEEINVGIPSVYWFSLTTFSDDSEYIEGTDDEYIIDIFSPGKVRFKNLSKVYDSAWLALKATGDWFMYSTEPLDMHSIELWSKDDSHLGFKVYASNEPGAESLLLDGAVIEVSEIDAGSGSYRYNHVHKLVRYTFPEGGEYKYYTIKGSEPGTNPAVVMTSQYIYVYYFK